MGSSMALAWNNIGAAVAWGAIVLALMLVSIATGLAGLIVLFPLVGHGAWHAYQGMCADASGRSPGKGREEPSV
jgi:uncharacterized membrane protein